MRRGEIESKPAAGFELIALEEETEMTRLETVLCCEAPS